MTDEQDLQDNGEIEPAGPGAAAHEPEHEQVDGEAIAVPAGDLTGSITAAIEDITDPDSDDS